ncbi:MAG: 50S ribosomal protein L13 [Parcubacteria group bacterium GW2011_GWC1_41_7]|nr:MAG: 50S ribosomal protein L13 [Parcubacteria group bacterium GW2011_GWC1_41_7]
MTIKTKEKIIGSATPSLKLKMEVVEFDALHKPLGRLATDIAKVLRGKHRADYSPHMDFPIHVKLKNWDGIVFTGSKFKDIVFKKGTGYIGHIKERKLEDAWKMKPLWVIQKAVSGMLPKNKLRDRRLKRISLIP